MRAFTRNALIGGVLVLLPLVILFALFRWAFYLVTDLIQPFTDYFSKLLQLSEIVADSLVILVILSGCFMIGTLVSTRVGQWLHRHFDHHLARLAPGYRLVKEIVNQLLGDSESSPFSKGEVARVRLFGLQCQTSVTAIVTSRHKDGTVTIFVPTGPNPTSGNIYHVPENLVTYYREASMEKMMKSIIACGAGSDQLFASPATWSEAEKLEASTDQT